MIKRYVNAMQPCVHVPAPGCDHAKELYPMDVTFSPAHLSGTVKAPASKSEAHRRMICAGLTADTTRLTGFMDSADMAATSRCLTALGASITRDSLDTITLRGFAAKHALLPVFDCGESGSTLRFFVPLALALTGGGIFRMHGRLGQRPMDVYRELFVPRGVFWRMGEGADGAAELTVAGSVQPGSYVLPGNVSSQFVSGLLFALPLLAGDSTLTVQPPVESAGYIAMTVKAIEQSGIAITEVAPFSWKIPGCQHYHAQSGHLHGDWSQAAVLLCAGALGHDVKVTHLSTKTVQGDVAVLRHLEALGAEVTQDEEGIAVKPGKLHGATLDMRNCPDIAPILALVCQMAPGESRLAGCARLRLKECDRLSATVALLGTLGGCARENGDDIVITGVSQLHGGKVADDNDHRMVMLASIAALCATGPVTVPEAEALNKSWPDYLKVYRSLGGQAQ